MKAQAVLLIGITILLCITILFAFYQPYSADDFTETFITVQSGETAWEIASRYCPESMDIRDYLQLCANANGIDDIGTVKAGDTIIFLQLKGEQQ
jgi:LysM domain.